MAKENKKRQDIYRELVDLKLTAELEQSDQLEVFGRETVIEGHLAEQIGELIWLYYRQFKQGNFKYLEPLTFMRVQEELRKINSLL